MAKQWMGLSKYKPTDLSVITDEIITDETRVLNERLVQSSLTLLRNSDDLEKVAAKSHVRGPIKAYRLECFKDINGIRASIGWDTVDVLLAQKKGWRVFTDKNLIVKHLKSTGKKYSLKSKFFQGEALYKMRFGVVLSILSIIKSSFNTNDPLKILFATAGFLISFLKQKPFIVDDEEGIYIRNFRWKIIYTKYLKF